MKVKTFTLLAGAAGMLAVTGLANAGISGLYAESVASNTLTNTTLEGTTYRIYVQFDNPADRFISALDGNIDFLTPLYQAPAGGTNFGPHDPLFDGLIADLAADSYVAVNGGTPGPDGGWVGADFSSGAGITGGWFISPPEDPANAQDGNGRVLVMFLTFLGAGHPQVEGIIGTNDGSGVIDSTVLGDLLQGSIRFAYNPDGAAAGAITGVTINFLPVPGPGALALLGVAGLVGKRRRRA